MQVDLIKPKLRPPGTKRWKLKFYTLLSTSAFKFNLCHYILDAIRGKVESGDLKTGADMKGAGAYTRSHFRST